MKIAIRFGIMCPLNVYLKIKFGNRFLKNMHKNLKFLIRTLDFDIVSETLVNVTLVYQPESHSVRLLWKCANLKF